MTRLLLLALAGAALAFAAGDGGHGGDNLTMWKVVNFALLAAALGYAIARKAPAFFQGRTAEIQKGIDEAARMKADAEARAGEIERRMASLGADVEALRVSARQDMETKNQQLREETGELLAKIQRQAEHEIASAAKAARLQLRAEAADLAIRLAEQQLRHRLTAEAEQGLVKGFVEDLRKHAVAAPEVH